MEHIQPTLTVANGSRVEWPSPLWIFGYGSLTWKIDFKHVDRLVGRVDGYVRRFWQASLDHRGVPGAPGRVVTLVPQAGGETWGVAYRIAPEDADEVMAYLDYREKGGYAAFTVDVVPASGSGDRVAALIYLGTDDNPQFIGDAPLGEMAAQIHRSVGPSGPNREYLFNLAAAMRDVAPHAADEHLFALEAAVRALEAAETEASNHGETRKHSNHKKVAEGSNSRKEAVVCKDN